MPTITEQPTFNDMQKYVSPLEEERGLSGQEVLQKCLILGEEVGELFKAIRKYQSLSIDQNSEVGSLSEELADVLVMTCAIANRLEISLEQSFRDKEEISKISVWK